MIGQDEPVRKTLILLLALCVCDCAPAPVRRQQRAEFLKALRDDDGSPHRAQAAELEPRTDFERSLEVMIRDAERELIANGECTWRLRTRCKKGFELSESDGFVGDSEYFDEAGHSIGEQNWSCLGGDRKGKTPRCQVLEEERLCPRALARLQRVSATIEFRNQQLKISTDAQFGTTDFGGVIKFESDPLKPLLLTITAIPAGLELRAGPMIDRMETIRVGDSFELPASIHVNDCVAPLTVRSEYVRIAPLSPAPLPAAQGEGVRSRSASAEPAAR